MAKWSNDAVGQLAKIRKSAILLPETVAALERDIDAWASGLSPTGGNAQSRFTVRTLAGGYEFVTAGTVSQNGMIQIASLVQNDGPSEPSVTVSFSPSAEADLDSLKSQIRIGGDLMADDLKSETKRWAENEARHWPDGSVNQSGRLGFKDSIKSWRAVAWRYGVDIQINVQIVRVHNPP